MRGSWWFRSPCEKRSATRDGKYAGAQRRATWESKGAAVTKTDATSTRPGQDHAYARSGCGLSCGPGSWISDVGSLVGAAVGVVGSAVGIGTGTAVGSGTGTTVGTGTGTAVGSPVGTGMGTGVGTGTGTAVGSVVGVSVTVGAGDTVGYGCQPRSTWSSSIGVVGCIVRCHGSIEGLLVTVGEGVGTAVGMRVRLSGLSDGANVFGALVGRWTFVFIIAKVVGGDVVSAVGV